MKIALLGDTAFYGKFSLEQGDPKKILHNTTEVLRSHDYVVLNLEAPFASKNAKKFGNKSAYIKSVPENIELLKYLRVNAVCLANNHMFDYGYESFELTKKLLADNGIEYFGVENNDLKVELLGNRIAFSGYCCYSTNPINATSKGVNPLDYNIVKKKLIDDHSKGYTSILSIHAGQEHVNYPNYDHVEIARKLAIVAPFVYYGHHPHVLQGVEEYNESLFSYSLGNFCFDDVYTDKSKDPLVKMSDNNKESAILSLEYDDSKLIGYNFIPLYDGQVCEMEQSENILKKLSEYSNSLYEDKEIYNERRSYLLNAYIKSRKSKRDVNWYLKRLNFNSIKMILNNMLNQKRYQEFITKYL
jgi:poly-gamma-glutamate synthesis protein (capsule biosynthesis protein)